MLTLRKLPNGIYRISGLFYPASVGGGRNPAVRGGRSSNDGTSDEECLIDKIQELFNEREQNMAQLFTYSN